MTDNFDNPLQEFEDDLFGRHIELPENVAQEFLKAVIAEHLKKNSGNINFKDLMHEIRDAHQQSRRM